MRLLVSSYLSGLTDMATVVLVLISWSEEGIVTYPPPDMSELTDLLAPALLSQVFPPLLGHSQSLLSRAGQGREANIDCFSLADQHH